MKHRKLHEFAKFAAGLVAADLLIGWWLWATGKLPVDILGMSLTEQMVGPWLAFDIAALIILVHYAWNIGKTPTIREHTYLLFAGLLFSVVFVLHLTRLFFGIDLVIGSWETPVWLSWFGTIVAAYLAYMSFHISLLQSRGKK